MTYSYALFNQIDDRYPRSTSKYGEGIHTGALSSPDKRLFGKWVSPEAFDAMVLAGFPISEKNKYLRTLIDSGLSEVEKHRKYAEEIKGITVDPELYAAAMRHGLATGLISYAAADIEEMYEIDFKAPVHPTIPQFIKNKLIYVMNKGGWEFINIQDTGEGYKIYCAKKGSISVAAIIGIILAVLAMVTIGVVSYTVLKVSNNKTQQVDDVSGTISGIAGYCQAAGLDQEECNELMQSAKDVYAAADIDGGNGFNWGSLNTMLPIALIGFLAIGAVGALKK